MKNSRVLLLTTVLAMGCDAATRSTGGPWVSTPDSAPEAGLIFLSPSPEAPPIGDRQVSFWAVKGETREVRVMFQASPGSTDSVEFARFKVDSRSLVNRPDGSALAPGDSLRITLTVVDTLRFITEFQPSGLVFDPTRPARLWLKFGEADPDLNHDGVVDAADTTYILSLRIWGQEEPTAPWVALPSTVNLTTQEVEADIPGFTRYAVAY